MTSPDKPNFDAVPIPEDLRCGLPQDNEFISGVDPKSTRETTGIVGEDLDSPLEIDPTFLLEGRIG